MKYIDAEKLKAEIERLEVLYDEALKNPSFASYESSLIAKGKHRQREDLLSFIDSLQQEQPEGNLEKEIQRYLCEECSSDDEPTIAEIARHFYELGRTEGIKGNLEEVPSNVDFNGKKTNKR